MDLRDLDTGTEHERVVECIDPAASYHAIIAIHSTVLGPSVGGSRLWSYDSTDAALADALRLSRGMTLKCAAAGLDLGGGKAVLIAPPSPVNREPLFRAHGRAIQQLGGRFITGEDVGTSPSDMEYVFRETRGSSQQSAGAGSGRSRPGGSGHPVRSRLHCERRWSHQRLPRDRRLGSAAGSRAHRGDLRYDPGGAATARAGWDHDRRSRSAGGGGQT